MNSNKLKIYPAWSLLLLDQLADVKKQAKQNFNRKSISGKSLDTSNEYLINNIKAELDSTKINSEDLSNLEISMHLSRQEVKMQPSIQLGNTHENLKVRMTGKVTWSQIPVIRIVAADGTTILDDWFNPRGMTLEVLTSGTYVVSIGDSTQYFMKKINVE